MLDFQQSFNDQEETEIVDLVIKKQIKKTKTNHIKNGYFTFIKRKFDIIALTGIDSNTNRTNQDVKNFKQNSLLNVKRICDIKGRLLIGKGLNFKL